MDLSDAVKVMRGKPGTPIVLTVVREGEDAPLEITIKRDVIRVTSVRSRMLQDGFGYLRISTFQSRTGQNLRDAVAKLQKENGGDLEGMVLDLRNNPGGVLNAAVAVSATRSWSTALIVYTEGTRRADSQLRVQAPQPDRHPRGLADRRAGQQKAPRRPRRSWPARYRTIKPRGDHGPARPSARVRCRPSCRWKTRPPRSS